MLLRRNVAAGIGSNEQGEYCRAALQRSDRKKPRYKWPTLLYFNNSRILRYSVALTDCSLLTLFHITRTTVRFCLNVLYSAHDVKQRQ